jgi:hypothetical protein
MEEAMNKWINRVIRSKTMIAFLIIDLIGVLQLSEDFLSTIMTPSQFGWFIIAIGFIGKSLRYVTTQDIKDK